jgi:hypothetical protein
MDRFPHTRPFVRTLLAFGAGLALLAGTGTVPLAAEEPRSSEYSVKAAFIYNFFKFVDWKEDSSGDFVFCVKGEAPFISDFANLKGKAVDGKKIVIRQVGESEIVRCKALFITSSEQGNISRLMRESKALGILTIGDTGGFGQKGVMINFYLDQNKVRFEINPAAAEEAGISISSKLLSLATIVHSMP